MVGAKHIPLRCCISCGQRLPKRELVRIVCNPQGRIEIDLTGKMNGRGAYLCHDVRCWEQGLKRSRLDQVLRTPVPIAVKENLLEYYREELSPSTV
jgi:predicted RNA-binding protein YlxR (DUF448 family)